MKWICPNLSKGPVLSNPSLEVEEKANSLNKNQKIHQHRYKMINTIMRILTIITTTRIIEVNPEGVDPIEAKIQVISLEAKIFMAEANEIRTHTKANIKMNGYQSNNYQGNRGFYHNPHRNFSQGNSYSHSRGRSHGQGRGNYHGCGQGTSNYQGNADYQYHQYYGHDDEYQTEQYGPPCALCSSYNHSAKHCFKGEHDINDIMEKMNINGYQSQSNGLYSPNNKI